MRTIRSCAKSSRSQSIDFPSPAAPPPVLQALCTGGGAVTDAFMHGLTMAIGFIGFISPLLAVLFCIGMGMMLVDAAKSLKNELDFRRLRRKWRGFHGE